MARITHSRHDLEAVGVQELQERYPGETQADLKRFLFLARERGLSRENTLFALDFWRSAAAANARLEAMAADPTAAHVSAGSRRYM